MVMAIWYDPRTWFRAEGEAKALTSDVFRGGASTTSGVAVTWSTALQASVVLACARVISEGMSQIPFRLMRRTGDTRMPAEDHPLYPLLEWAPNPWQTPTELFDQIGMHLVLTGNAYVWINRARGAVRELLPFDPSSVEVKRDGYELRYWFTLTDGKRQEVPARDVWHLRGPSWDGVLGIDVVRAAREAIGLSLAGERAVSATMSNGARLSGLLSTDANLTREQRSQLRESWQESQSGAANAGKIAVMSNGMKFQPMQMSAVETQQIEQRKFQIEEVCRAFRVAPTMVGATDKTATFASAEAFMRSHVINCLGPWHQRVERSATKALLAEPERMSGLYFKFFTQALLRGAPGERASFYASLFGVGALSPNEIRGFEDMNPYPDGDAFRLPLNMEDPANPQPRAVPAMAAAEDGEDEDEE